MGDRVDRALPPPDSAAPRVHVVMVAHEPGPWFDESLAALAVQDYQRLQVTVVAAGGERVVRQLVEQRLPAASVVSVDPRHGYGRSANTVLEHEGRPAYYLFCHDDVALAPDAVRLLVEESLRSNAGVVGPKLVDWENPDELLDVGFDVDKLGHLTARVEPGELDQEQHDAVVDVFALSGAAILVRADLFAALGGFDGAMGVTGEDLDLCWRAHIAGARVMVVPSAVGRHREGMRTRRTTVAVERVRERHRIRTLLSNYGVAHSVRVLPQAALFSVLRSVAALVTGRFGRAASFLGAWFWNLRHPGSLLRRRRALAKVRKLPDKDIRNLQVSGFSPLSAFLRGQLRPDHVAGSLSVRARDLMLSLRTGPSRVSFGFWAVAVAVLAFGSRHLLTRRVPVVGDLVPFDLTVREQFATFFDSWWSSGTGHEGAAPTAHLLVGALGTVFLGAMGLLRTVLTVGMLPLGAVGMWRFLRPFDSPWIRLVGTAMYLSVPVPYDALRHGSWGALVLFGLLPWALAAIGRGGQLAPFGERGGLAGPGVGSPNIVGEILTFGMVIALIGAVAPVGAVIVVALVLVVIVGSVLGGGPVGAGRLLGVGLGAAAVAAVLHLPWLIDALRAGAGWDWLAGTRPEAGRSVDLSTAFRLSTETGSVNELGWALLVAAVAPLLLARGDRWAWAVRGWALYLAGVAAVWADGNAWIDLPGPRPELLLAPAGLGLAVAIAMGVAAIQRDLRTFGFGWRQLVPLAAIVGIVVATAPTFERSWSGQWGMVDTELNRPLASTEADLNGRTLWIGHDDVLAAAGQRFRGDVTLAVSNDSVSSFGDQFAGVPEPGDDLLHEAVQLAVDGGTSRLGRLLAPLGIAEIVIVERAAPPPSTGILAPIDASITAALSEQLDLERVDVAPGIIRYRNTSSLGLASLVPGGATSERSIRAFVAAPTATEAVPLPVGDAVPPTYSGRATETTEVFVAVPSESAWTLEVDGVEIPPRTALDWATAFRPELPGPAELSHTTTTRHRATLGAQAALWAIALVAVVRFGGNRGVVS